MSLEQDLENARQIFVAHYKACPACQRYKHADSATLTLLCYDGTVKYKELLRQENLYVSHAKSLERAAERRAERKRTAVWL